VPQLFHTADRGQCRDAGLHADNAAPADGALAEDLEARLQIVMKDGTRAWVDLNLPAVQTQGFSALSDLVGALNTALGTALTNEGLGTSAMSFVADGANLVININSTQIASLFIYNGASWALTTARPREPTSCTMQMRPHDHGGRQCGRRLEHDRPGRCERPRGIPHNTSLNITTRMTLETGSA